MLLIIFCFYLPITSNLLLVGVVSERSHPSNHKNLEKILAPHIVGHGRYQELQRCNQPELAYLSPASSSLMKATILLMIHGIASHEEDCTATA
jgi:hypothetical protein